MGARNKWSISWHCALSLLKEDARVAFSVFSEPENPLEIFECPARVNEPLRREIADVALRAFHALGCRDWTRVDVRLDGAGRANVVEVNPLPGVLPDAADNSCLPKAARAAGLDYDALIGACLQAAADRQGVALGGGAQ